MLPLLHLLTLLSGPSEAGENTVRAYIGLEYECPRGHRFFCSAPDKVIKVLGSCTVKVCKIWLWNPALSGCVEYMALPWCVKDVWHICEMQHAQHVNALCFFLCETFSRCFRTYEELHLAKPMPWKICFLNLYIINGMTHVKSCVYQILDDVM